jgi:hypothetical protein
MYESGLVRIATEQYTTKSNRKRFIHLTNYSIQKKAPGYIQGDVDLEEGTGNKWTFEHLRQYFASEGIPEAYDVVFERIKDLIVKTVISVDPSISNNMSRATKHRGVSFELFGFDVLIDANMKPWLLEVNVAPSLSGGSVLDRVIKTSLITDTLNLVGFVPYDRVRTEKAHDASRINRLLGKGPTAKRSSTSKATRGALRLNLDDANMIADVDDEFHRRGYFELLFPKRENTKYYAQFFESIKPNNAMLWKWLEWGQGLLEPYYHKKPIVANV